MKADDCKEVPSSECVAAPVCPVVEPVESGNEELEAQEEEEQADVPLCLPHNINRRIANTLITA